MSNNDKPKHVSSLLDLFTKDEILKRAQLERDKSYDIRAIFEQMELDLIASMRRAFYFHQAEQIKEGFEWEQWQLTKLREIEKYRKRNKALVEAYNKPIQDAIDRELKQSYTKGEGRIKQFINKLKHLFNKKVAKQQSIMLPSDTSSAQPLRDYIAKATGMPKKIPPETNFFGVNDKKLEALMKSVNKDLEKAQYSVLRKMDDVYRQTIFKSQLYMQGGAKTLYQAIDMATKDFLDKGINSIVYANGKRVNIASYAEMALRTASHRATLLGEGKKRDEWGLHLIVVSAHANTCPKCEKWQGKILIDDVFSRGSKSDGDYPLLSEAIKTGLLHPNCRHTLITYFPDITQPPTVPNGEDAIKTYEAEQQQRAYERKLRKWKRHAEGSFDHENAKNAEQKVAYYEKVLREHLREHPQLRRNRQREKVFVSKQSGARVKEGSVEWYFEREKKAEEFYKAMRQEHSDIKKISENTKLPISKIKRIKAHVFLNKHILRENIVREFDPDISIVESWTRLMNGNHTEVDIILLRHEHLEYCLEKRYNLTYQEAHKLANTKYNWEEQTK